MKSGKINILQVPGALGIGGTEKAAQIISENLNKKIFNVFIATTNKFGLRAKILRKKGITSHQFNNNYDDIIDFLVNKNIDVIHIHSTEPNEPHYVLEAAKKLNLPVIETNVFGYYSNDSTYKTIVKRHLIVSKTTAYKYMLGANIDAKDFLKSNRVIYNPVVIDDFDKTIPKEDDIVQFKSKLGVGDNHLILRIGRTDQWKWNRYPVDMMNFLSKKLSNVRYLIVGGIPEFIETYIKKKNLSRYFIKIGHVNEKTLLKVYHSADVLAHTSRIGESFGYTIAEAMAARKPVVVNSTPWKDNAQIELVDNNITGFTKLTPKEYANAVYYLLKNKEVSTQMGINGYRKAKAQFDIKKIIKMVEKIYIDTLFEMNKIGKDIKNHYSKIRFFPTDSDIINYKKDYKRRLKESYGNSNIFTKMITASKYASPRLKEIPMYFKYFMRKESYSFIPP